MYIVCTWDCSVCWYVCTVQWLVCVHCLYIGLICVMILFYIGLVCVHCLYMRLLCVLICMYCTMVGMCALSVHRSDMCYGIIVHWSGMCTLFVHETALCVHTYVQLSGMCAWAWDVCWCSRLLQRFKANSSCPALHIAACYVFTVTAVKLVPTGKFKRIFAHQNFIRWPKLKFFSEYLLPMHGELGEFQTVAQE